MDIFRLNRLWCARLVSIPTFTKDADKNRKDQTDNTDPVDHADDGLGDMLLTGLLLNEIHDDDNPPDAAGSDGFDSVDDGGGFDGGGFDGGGFDGGGFDGGGFE